MFFRGMIEMGTLVVTLRASGMFCELNHTVAAAGFAEDHGLAVRPVWRGGLYAPPGEDAWPRFFEQPKVPAGVAIETRNRDPRFRPYRYAAPRGPRLPAEYAESACGTFLLPPNNRKEAGRLIEKYVQPRPAIEQAIRESRGPLADYEHVIGLHLRGPLRLHGGAAYLSDQLGRGRPPYAAYFAHVDRYLDTWPGSTAILLCTDAGCVVREVQSRYGERVIVPSQCLPERGEPHKGDAHGRHELGVDAISDAWLLGGADVLIHGNSNLSNFVLCLSPEMPHADVYQNVYPSART